MIHRTPLPAHDRRGASRLFCSTGVGVWEAFRLLRKRFYRGSEIKAGIVVAAVCSFLVLVQGVLTYRTYFQEWAVQPELYKAYEVPWINLTRVLNALPSDGGTVYLVPNSQHPYSFRYLYQGAPPAHLYHPATPNLAQEIESMLTTMENVSTVKVVEWQGKAAWIGEDPGRSALLLSKYGRYQGGEDYPTFRIHRYSNISLERPWTFYEFLEPLTVDYDGGIALRGLALGQGEDQLSSQQALELGRERPLWMALRWQITSGLDIDYAISLRLHDAAGERVFQEDAVLWNPVHWPTSSWSEEEPVDTTALLKIPAELSAGEYELRVVVYDVETLVPTVEIGVWEPEVTLARLRLAEVQ